jgi:radical SAM protein with 4Fe4S-binding SPASM domain
LAIVVKKLISLGQARGARYLGALVHIDDLLAEISEKPIHLGIEGTNICNANCIFCGYQYLDRPKTVLPMDLFQKGIDEFDAFGGGSVGFNPVVGDCLVDPDIVAKIQYARSKKNVGRIGLFTNGILINKIGAADLLASGLDDITISIGGFDDETYRRIFRVDRWESVRDGIFALLQENAASGHRVKICLALRSDVPIWESLKKPAYQELKGHKFDLEFNIRHFDNWSGRIEQEQLSGTMRLKEVPQKREPCSVLYRALKILSNGDVTLCGCRDLNGDSELVLGNLRDRSLYEMWHDPRVEEIRNGFYRSRYPEICRDCSMYEGLEFFRRQKLRSWRRAIWRNMVS